MAAKYTYTCWKIVNKKKYKIDKNRCYTLTCAKDLQSIQVVYNMEKNKKIKE